MKDIYNTDKCKGILHLDIFQNGEKIAEEQYNMIVDDSSAILARLIGMQGTYADKAITKISFSDGNAPVGRTKTDLDGSNKYTKDIDSVTYDDVSTPYDVQFNFTLGTTEFNGYNIWQFGLKSGDGKLFSMLSRNPEKAFPIEKGVDVTVSGWWKILFRNSA